MSDPTIHFYEHAPDGLRQKYAVIIAIYQGQLLWCRHRARYTWELPGGHIERNETALQAAARELYEETGASSFTLRPICWYSVVPSYGISESLGLLCIAEVHTLGCLEREIAEVNAFPAMPDSLTYPDIQPCLLAEARRRGFI